MNRIPPYTPQKTNLIHNSTIPTQVTKELDKANTLNVDSAQQQLQYNEFISTGDYAYQQRNRELAISEGSDEKIDLLKRNAQQDPAPQFSNNKRFAQDACNND